MKRLQKQLLEVSSMKEQGVEVKTKESLYHWDLVLVGPIGSPFQGKPLSLDIDFPEQFPFKFPQFRFRTPLWHPNIKEGLVCREMLGQKEWAPNKTVSQVILTILSMLAHPQIHSAINLDAATQFREGTYFNIAKQQLENALK